MKVIDMSGRRYGKWTVMQRVENSKNGQAMWLCKCDCGTEKVVCGSNLRSGASRSCGCERNSYFSALYGVHYKEPKRLFSIWSNMKSRCTNPNNNSFQNYGARGIKICNEWLHDFVAFREWALQNGYSDNLTIERIDNEGNYEPTNCRWATAEEQSNNRRNNVLISHNGETHTLNEWSKIIGVKKSTIESRYSRGWSEDRILTEPLHNVNNGGLTDVSSD